MNSKNYLEWLKDEIMEFYHKEGFIFNYKMLAVMIFEKHFLGALKSRNISVGGYLNGRIEFTFNQMAELAAEHISNLMNCKLRPYKMKLSIWKDNGVYIYLEESRKSCLGLGIQKMKKMTRLKKARFIGQWDYIPLSILPTTVELEDLNNVIEIPFNDLEFQKYLQSYDPNDSELADFLNDVNWETPENDPDNLLSDWKDFIIDADTEHAEVQSVLGPFLKNNIL